MTLVACGGDARTSTRSDSTASSSSTSKPARASGEAAFSDSKSSLSYEIPDTWFGPLTEDLTFFSSYISSADPSASSTGSSSGGSSASAGATASGLDPDRPKAIAGTGTFEGLFADPARGLQEATNSAAAGFAEYFIPQPGKRETIVDEATTVSGDRAWHVRFRIVLDDAPARPATVEMIAVDLPQPAYLLTLVDGDDPQLFSDVASIFASLTVG